MKKSVKNGLVAVVACVACYVLGSLIGWPVNKNDARGNISKAVRYNKSVISDDAKAVQEFIQSDDEYREQSVYAFMVMDARVNEFVELAQLSVAAAGDREEFAGVVKALNDALPMALNARKAFEQTAVDLNALLEGSSPVVSYEQNSNNAMLAYIKLQTLNPVCEEFVHITDALAGCDDEDLLFARDGWVSYNLVSAMLDDDEEDVYAWSEIGCRLSAEQMALVEDRQKDEFRQHHMNWVLVASAVDGLWSSTKIDATLLKQNQLKALLEGAKMAPAAMNLFEERLKIDLGIKDKVNAGGFTDQPTLDMWIVGNGYLLAGLTNEEILRIALLLKDDNEMKFWDAAGLLKFVEQHEQVDAALRASIGFKAKYCPAYIIAMYENVQGVVYRCFEAWQVSLDLSIKNSNEVKNVIDNQTEDIARFIKIGEAPFVNIGQNAFKSSCEFIQQAKLPFVYSLFRDTDKAKEMPLAAGFCDVVNLDPLKYIRNSRINTDQRNLIIEDFDVLGVLPFPNDLSPRPPKKD